MLIPLISRLIPANAMPRSSPGMYVLTGEKPNVTINDGILRITPGISSVASPDLREEWITTGESWTTTQNGPLTLLQTQALLFAVYLSPETDILNQTDIAYRTLFSEMTARGFPHALRVWNYMGGIHQRILEHDHYQAFCIGRARALGAMNLADNAMPAATAIGTLHPGIIVYVIAARGPGVGIENPRQMSAYRYPPQYSPESPAFARATRIQTESGAQLLVSGTASIVGHQSLHSGDPIRQTQEILRNLRALATASGLGDLEPKWLRIYLRDAADRNGVHAVLAAEFPSLPPLQWICGDVCRQELLVEIEGVYAPPPGSELSGTNLHA